MVQLLYCRYSASKENNFHYLHSKIKLDDGIVQNEWTKWKTWIKKQHYSKYSPILSKWNQYYIWNSLYPFTHSGWNLKLNVIFSSGIAWWNYFKNVWNLYWLFIHSNSSPLPWCFAEFPVLSFIEFLQKRCSIWLGLQTCFCEAFWFSVWPNRTLVLVLSYRFIFHFEVCIFLFHLLCWRLLCPWSVFFLKLVLC